MIGVLAERLLNSKLLSTLGNDALNEVGNSYLRLFPLIVPELANLMFWGPASMEGVCTSVG